MGFNELYSALQTGVVDGAENNPPTVFAQNHYQVSKVYSLTGHLIIPELFVFSKRTWDGMPKADQDALMKHSREAQLEQRQLWDAYTGEASHQAQGGPACSSSRPTRRRSTPRRSRSATSTAPSTPISSSASKRRPDRRTRQARARRARAPFLRIRVSTPS
jgi:hypothetical protein